MAAYIVPERVISPQKHWSLIKVLHDGGPENYSVALGRWDNEPVLGMRWNGSEDSPIGNPQSRGCPHGSLFREIIKKVSLSNSLRTWFPLSKRFSNKVMVPAMIFTTVQER
ncbi:MAG: hypothetical protein IPJ44_00010 [Nitrospira sp.]|nr:hypothetical protein [Nitrospira sp.]